MRPDEPLTGYAEGFRAGWDDDPGASPYGFGDPEGARWRRAFIDGQNSRRSSQGRGESTTRAEVEAARGRFDYVGERQDPVAAILGHPSDEFSVSGDDTTVPLVEVRNPGAWRRVAFQQQVDQFKALAQQADQFKRLAAFTEDIAQRIAKTGFKISEPPRSHDTQRSLASDHALNRKRHGSAAVCPRHGPTAGGLCRACRR